MKRLRSFFAVLLSLSVLILPGCTDFSKQSGFVQLSDMTPDNSYITDMDVCGNNLLVITTDEASGKTKMRLWDLKRNRLSAEKLLSSSEEFCVSSAEMTDEKIIIRDETNSKQYEYDYELTLTDTKKYQYVDEYQKMLESMDNADESFNILDSFASRIMGDRYEAVVFASDDSVTYFQEHPSSLNWLASFDKKILYYENKSNKLRFTVNDYAQEKVLNVEYLDITPYGSGASDLWLCGFSDKFVCVPITDEYGYIQNIYYWNYTVNQTDSPLKAVCMNNEQINEKCDELIDKIKKNYSVSVEINPKFSTDSFSEMDYKFTDNELPSAAYISLQLLEHTLSLYPKGIFQEICADDAFDDYKIYITGKINDENVDAYANNINGTVYIVLPTYNFSVDNITHEIMHTLDYKLIDIDDKWIDLNPDDFYYSGSETQYNSEDKYFVRPYGMANSLEDRAVTMEGLFCAAVNNQKPEFLNYPVIREKCELLCRELRANYKTVQNCENVIWEKYL